MMFSIKVERRTSRDFRRRIPREQPWYTSPKFFVNLKVNLRWAALRVVVPNPFRLLYLRGVRKRQDEFRAGIMGVGLGEFRRLAGDLQRTRADSIRHWR